MQKRSACAITLGFCALISGAALLLLLRPALRAPHASRPFANTPSLGAVVAAPAAHYSASVPDPVPPPESTDDTPPATPPPSASTAPLPQGVVAIWHGALPLPLKQFIARQDPDAPVPARLELPVNDHTRVPLHFKRIDFNGADAATLLGEVEGRPGSTVVLSHVGNSHAGVIHLPEENRSYVISGGEDGRIRVTATDLTRAPDCAPEPPRPPLALLAPQPSPPHSAP